MATPKKTAKKETKHITPELITRVILGEFGPAGERNANLLKEGWSPSAVTKKINELKKLVPGFLEVLSKAGAYAPSLITLALYYEDEPGDDIKDLRCRVWCTPDEDCS